MNELEKSTQDIITKQTLNRQALSTKFKRMTLTKPSTGGKKSFILGDISGSMSGEKLEALKDAYTACWRPSVTGVVFGSDVFLITQSDISSLKTQGTTSMGEALLCAWGEGADHIILITDGEPTDYKKPEILDLVRQHSSTPIDCIGISRGKYDSSYDPEFLNEISSITKGKYNSCDEPLQLTEMVETLLIGVPSGSSEGGAIQL
jgi:uncharacterized protein YegL